jgi:hypothetical protein
MGELRGMGETGIILYSPLCNQGPTQQANFGNIFDYLVNYLAMSSALDTSIHPAQRAYIKASVKTPIRESFLPGPATFPGPTASFAG